MLTSNPTKVFIYTVGKYFHLEKFKAPLSITLHLGSPKDPAKQRQARHVFSPPVAELRLSTHGPLQAWRGAGGHLALASNSGQHQFQTCLRSSSPAFRGT